MIGDEPSGIDALRRGPEGSLSELQYPAHALTHQFTIKPGCGSVVFIRLLTVGTRIMKIAQHKWSESTGWIPAFRDLADRGNEVAIVFGARALLEQGTPVEELRSRLAGGSLIGCSTSGEIMGDEVIEQSVTATIVSFEHGRSRIASVRIGEASSSREVGEQLARQLDDASLRHVFVLSDGLRVNGSDLARGLANGVASGVSITGGLSGDGTDFGETWVIANAQGGSGIVAALGLYGESLRIGYASLGGWQPFGPVRAITRAEGNVLYELDGRPALDLYKTYLGAHADQLPGAALLFPLLVVGERNGQGVVRTVLSVDDRDGSMTFAGDIPSGGTAQLMKTNVDNLVDGAIAAAEASLKGLGHQPPELALLVSCVGRKLVMKQRVEEEVEAIRDVFGADTKLAGFYSYGELCPFSQGEACRLHNQTMTITALAEV